MSEEEYIADHATTARLVKETGAKLMVMNTSCPNEGHNRLLCHNPLLVGRITEAVKQEIGDIPLMVKLAYIPSDDALELMVRSTVGHGTVQGFSTINTISAKLVDANGNQALPGAGRDRSGVCGNGPKDQGQPVNRLQKQATACTGRDSQTIPRQCPCCIEPVAVICNHGRTSCIT